MGKLILLNDVLTDADDAQLIVGDADPVANADGQAQADIVSAYLHEKIENIDYVYSSDALRLKKLVHKIRVNSKDQGLTSLTPRRLEGLRERSFGVLNRTPVMFDSDLFCHTRVKAEKGESIFECRGRVMRCVNDMVTRYPDSTILLVSHPFACQIIFNAALQKDHTILTKFWYDKGSFVVLAYKAGTYGTQWGFESGYNAISDTTYTQDEIYRHLLRKEGALTS